MRKVFMINHQVREPSLLQIKLITAFTNITPAEPPPHACLARFNLYTKHGVFEGELLRLHINEQMAWNEQCIGALTQSLSDRRPNKDIEFN